MCDLEAARLSTSGRLVRYSDMEYRMYDPATGDLRTEGGISEREYVRKVRGMTVEQFERRYGTPVSEFRADDDDYARRLIVLKRMDNV